MKKFINKFLILGLLFCTFFTNIPTYALDFEEITSNKITSTTVKADVSSSFSVQIPKFIELIDIGTKYSADYAITVTGDIAGDEILSVVPDSSVTLSSTGKADITATVTQDKTEWDYTDIASKVANGNISVNDVKAGSWTGELNFNISLGAIQPVTLAAGLYDENNELIISWEDSGIDDTCSNASDVIYDNCNSDVCHLVISDSVTTISSSAFSDIVKCEYLYTVTIPSSVMTIEDGAFGGAPYIGTIYFNGTEEQWNAISKGTGDGILEIAEIIFNN